MNNSNNFNVCEKCGTANPLIAKYCYQCGAHLKTPEDPIVCNNCNTVNSGSARYCKHCGNKLFRGSTVKICPRCNHTVNGDAYICERCGFEFVAMRPVVQNIPQLPQNAGGSAEGRKPTKKELRKQQTAQQTYYAPPVQPVYGQPQQAVYLPAAAAQTVAPKKRAARASGHGAQSLCFCRWLFCTPLWAIPRYCRKSLSEEKCWVISPSEEISRRQDSCFGAL